VGEAFAPIAVTRAQILAKSFAVHAARKHQSDDGYKKGSDEHANLHRCRQGIADVACSLSIAAHGRRQHELQMKSSVRDRSSTVSPAHLPGMPGFFAFRRNSVERRSGSHAYLSQCDAIAASWPRCGRLLVREQITPAHSIDVEGGHDTTA